MRDICIFSDICTNIVLNGNVSFDDPVIYMVQGHEQVLRKLPSITIFA